MAEREYIIGPGSLRTGRSILGPFVVENDIRDFTISLDNTQHLNPAVFTTVSLEMSHDSGATWKHVVGGGRFGGGPIFGEDGEPVTTFGFSTDLPPPINDVKRMARIVVENTKGSFMTAGGALRVR